MSKRAAAEKVRLAYEMNEMGYPMTAEQVRLRPVITKDARRVRLSGSYRRAPPRQVADEEDSPG